MSMYELTQIIWRRRAIVAVVTALLLGIGRAFVCAGLLHMTYTARAEVLVDQPQLVGALDGINVPNKINAFLPTLCSLLRGDDAVSKIAAASEEAPAAVRASAQCRARESTTIADITSTTRSAPRSQKLAAATTDTFVAEIQARY